MSDVWNISGVWEIRRAITGKLGLGFCSPEWESAYGLHGLYKLAREHLGESKDL